MASAAAATDRSVVAETRLLDAFTETRPALLQTLAHQLGNRDDAQDAVQDAFLKCWRRRAKLRRVRDLRAWIFRVGLNTAKDLLRNAWRRRSRPLLVEAPVLESQHDLSPPALAEEAEDLTRLRYAIQHHLRREEREIFLLRQNSALTYEEIAARRRIPVGTVKTQMRTALLKLRAVLGAN